MKLYFLRHGLAGQHGDPKYPDDSLRPLTKQGQDKMQLEARGMQALGLNFDAILSSPYLRALQTATIVAQAYSINEKKIHRTKNLLPPATIETLLTEINTHFPKSKNILLTGHEPHLSTMITTLLQVEPSMPIDFKKGGLCCLKIDRDLKRPASTLLWLLTPGQLIKIKP